VLELVPDATTTPPVTQMLQRPRRVAHQSVTAHFRWPEHASAKAPSLCWAALSKQQPRARQTRPSRDQIPTFFGLDQAGLDSSNSCRLLGSRHNLGRGTFCGPGEMGQQTTSLARKKESCRRSPFQRHKRLSVGPSLPTYSIEDTHSDAHTRTDACCFCCRLVIVTASSILSPRPSVPCGIMRGHSEGPSVSTGPKACHAATTSDVDYSLSDP
jgi:hypothetical protein